MLSRVAFWGVIPVKHKLILLTPVCSSPLINEALPESWLGRYMRMDSPYNTVCTVPQSVQYHKLPPPEMEFLDVKLIEDSSLSLHTIHRPFYWKILIEYHTLLW
jgi:hypothetical protein